MGRPQFRGEFPEIICAPPAISTDPHPDHNRGYGWIEFDQFPPPPRAWAHGDRNAVPLSAIRIEKEMHLVSRRNGRNFARILQISRDSIRHFLGIPIQTLIAAKDGPNLPKFHTPRAFV